MQGRLYSYNLSNMTWKIILLLAVTFILSLGITRFLIGYLGSKSIVDVPNARSNHSRAIPRGGGIAIIASMLFSFVALSFYSTNILYLIPGIFVLALISWVDDRKGVNPLFRLIIQAIVCAYTVWIFFAESSLISQNTIMPYFLPILVFFIMMWFINLYNFMDGIDGITGSYGIMICLTLFLFSMLDFYPKFLGIVALCVTASILGFIIFNWHPAKIFMGDVGSIPLGYVLAVMLIFLAFNDNWVAALIIPLYYLADASITLVKRFIQGKKIWQAHSEHFYQRAVRAGVKHSNVVIIILCFGFLIIDHAILAALYPLYKIHVLISAFIVALVLLGLLYRLSTANKA